MRLTCARIVSLVIAAGCIGMPAEVAAAQDDRAAKENRESRDATTGQRIRRSVINLEQLAQRARPGQVRIGKPGRAAARPASRAPVIARAEPAPSQPLIDLGEDDIAPRSGSDRDAAPVAPVLDALATQRREPAAATRSSGALRVIRVDRVSGRGPVAWSSGDGEWIAPAVGATAVDRALVKTGHRAGIDLTIETPDGWIAAKFGRLTEATVTVPPEGAPMIEIEHGIAWVGSADAGRPWTVLVRSPDGERVLGDSRYGGGAMVRFDAFDGLWVEPAPPEGPAEPLSLTTP